MERLLRDFRTGARSLRRSPGHSAVVVLTLAMGIAAATVVFSVMNPYLVRPLPFAAPDRLIQIEQVEPQRGSRWVRFSLPQWVDWRSANRSLADVAAYRYSTANVGGDGGGDGFPERLMISWTTPNLFAVLGEPALHGRTYRGAEGGPSAEPVTVLSHGLWATRYGGDPGIIGRTVRLDGVAHTVLGVMPPRFTFPWNEVKAWVPERRPGAWSDRTLQSFILVGRLADGWTRDRAEADLLRVQRELGSAYPEADGMYAGLNIRPMREALNFGYEAVRLGFTLLMAAVGILLLIACVNVAGLMLARATARSREMAVRRALGAGRGRLTGQLLAESAMLAAAGGIAGLGLARLMIGVIGPALPEDLFRVGTASMDWRVVLFGLGLITATPLLFGLSSALSAARTAPAEALRSGARAGDRAGTRRRAALVVVQVGLAVVLAAMTSLLGRSLLAVQRIDTGFQPERMLVAEATPPLASHPDDRAVESFFDRAAAALGSLPGVEVVGATSRLPLNHETFRVAYRAAGGEGGMESWPDAIYSSVDGDYFDATETPVLEGRGFVPSDGEGTTPVVVVSRSLAEREWPGESALGRTLRVATSDPATHATVVGVVGDIRWADLTTPPAPHVYAPLTGAQARRRFLVAKVAGPLDPGTMVDAARRTVAGLDPAVPLTVRPMRRVLRENDFPWVVSSVAVGVFGVMALLLASLGIYGLIAYSVALRRRELGIRAALGAGSRALRRMVLGQGLRLAAAGLAVGLALALVAGRLLGSLLYGVGRADPVTFGLVTALFLGVAAAAAGIPAMRAARVEPAEVMREE